MSEGRTSIETAIRKLEEQYQQTKARDRRIGICFELQQSYETLASITGEIEFLRIATEYKMEAAGLCIEGSENYRGD